jgi:PAS domain S-box-containing protein
MKDGEKTKEQLVKEATELRTRIKELEENLGSVLKERTDEIAQANKQLKKELTDRKKFEQELKQSEEKFHSLVETANAGIIAAESGVITLVNKKAETIYGYTREELIGQPAGILAPEHYKKQHKEILERMLSSAQVEQLSFEEEGLRKDGSLFPAEMSFSLLKRGEGFGVIAVVTDITERKESEEELRNTRDYLENIIDSSIDSITISDSTGNITRVNKAFCTLLGYEEGELIGKHTMELSITEEGTYESTAGEVVEIDEEFFEGGRQMITRLFEEGKVECRQSYLVRKDKKVVPVEENIVLLFDEKGETVGSVGTIRDIAERRKAEKEIKETKDFLENIFKTTADGIMLIDDKGSVTMANNAVAKMLGYSTDELIEKHAKDLLPEEYKEKGLDFFAKLMGEGVVTGFEFAWLRKDGSLIDVGISATLLKDGEGNLTGGIISARDISERKKVMDELENTKDYLNNVIESSADSIIIADPAGTIVKTNKAFLELLGCEEEEVVGKHIVEFSATEEGTYESTTGEMIEINEEHFKNGKGMVAILYEDGKISNWESHYIRKDKKLVPVEMSIVFLYDRQGERIGSVGINRDITNRKKMEKQLKEATVQLVQSEKLSALGELTAGVAHELNQPLNGIKIISQSLLKDIERGKLDEEELGEDLKDVVNQVNKMAEIIDHMRIFTRRSEGVPQERIDLNDIVKGAFKFLGQQLRNHNIEVQENLGSELPKVLGDPIRLEQVFLNLVSNARNAVEGDGKEKKIIEIRTYADNINGDSSVVIEVKDNGGGMPEHVKGKIFQPFFTTNAPGKGTGLGLSVSSKIIEEHQGRIEMDSTMDEGATFRVILPAAEHRA